MHRGRDDGGTGSTAFLAEEVSQFKTSQTAMGEARTVVNPATSHEFRPA